MTDTAPAVLVETHDLPLADDHPSLHAAWEDRPGIPGFLTTVDHKRIGIRYLVTAVAFLLVGGVEALFMRLQLSGSANTVLGAQTYNEIMTMHGTTMIFLFNTPVFAGFGNYLVPLQVGARDMAFPRLNALSYWVYVLAGLLMYGGFVVHQIPAAGWFAYTPLSSSEYSAGLGLDYWAIGVTFLGVATTIGGVNFIVTILRLRAPGHVAQPLAPLLLGHPHDVVHDRVRPAGHHAGRRAARGRPCVQDALLRPVARRRPHPVPAPVLDLGPPRGLHPVHPGDRASSR